ncbi:MAG: hypothetical protein C4333_03190 [Meiothermus sp.]
MQKSFASSRFVPAHPQRTEGYLFVDNARFLSIVCIVLLHTNWFEVDPTPSLLESAVVALRGFGILTFFVITAFLMASKMQKPQFRVLEYYRDRVNRIGKPYLVWLAVLLSITFARLILLGKFRLVDIPLEIWHTTFFTAFWYIPVLLFSLAVMLLLRQHWWKPWFPVAALGVSGVYGVNQYFQWFTPIHSFAFFGFLFYMWLGLWLYRNLERVQGWVLALPWWKLLAVVALGLTLATAEARLLIHLGSLNPYDGLRLSNQIYALICLLVILKLPWRLSPSFVDVRKDSYGIHLVQVLINILGKSAITLALFALGLDRSFTFFDRVPDYVPNPLLRIAIWFSWFVLVYGISLWITQQIRRTRLAWIVGGG